MKKFIVKGTLFYTIILIIIITFLFLSVQGPTKPLIAEWTNSSDYMDDSGRLPRYEAARTQDGTTQLVIGDSICNQMFGGVSGYNPQASILGMDAAFMMTGQYLLAEEYLKNHPGTTDIFLIMHPLSITRTFDMEWTYRYGIMPYVETDTLQYLDQNTIDIMTETYGSFFLRSDVVSLIENSPVCRKLALNYILSNREPYVQENPFEIADQYVKKLYGLCQENNVRLHLYSSPVAEHYREQAAELSAEYEGTWMSRQYPDYFNNIYYYPDEWAEDLSHFSGEYAERDALNETIKKAYPDTVLLEKISLSPTD